MAQNQDLFFCSTTAVMQQIFLFTLSITNRSFRQTSHSPKIAPVAQTRNYCGLCLGGAPPVPRGRCVLYEVVEPDALHHAVPAIQYQAARPVPLAPVPLALVDADFVHALAVAVQRVLRECAFVDLPVGVQLALAAVLEVGEVPNIHCSRLATQTVLRTD